MFNSRLRAALWLALAWTVACDDSTTDPVGTLTDAATRYDVGGADGALGADLGRDTSVEDGSADQGLDMSSAVDGAEDRGLSDVSTQPEPDASPLQLDATRPDASGLEPDAEPNSDAQRPDTGTGADISVRDLGRDQDQGFDPDTALPDLGAAPDASPDLDSAAPDGPMPGCVPGLTRPCVEVPGCPDNAVESCVDGVWGACERPPEACNGLDDDCDGVSDEGLPLNTYFPDADGDGFYGPLLAEAQPSCAAWLQAGRRTDGIYPIDPDGAGEAPTLDVYCDMTRDGGGWTRVFFHDVAGGYWAGDQESLEHNADRPLAQRYSILSHLNALQSADESFEFRIEWPESAVEGRNIWRQTSNPTVDAIEGYEAITVDFATNGWGGLEYNSFNGATFIDGSVGVGIWYYALGTTAPWGNPAGIPSHAPSSPRVALWVRPDDAAVVIEQASVEACGPPQDHASDGGDCVLDNAAAHPGADEICDDVDNDCDGSVDEGFVYTQWYPDRDEDGRGASAGSSCASLLAGGAGDDGVYAIQPDADGGPTYDVFCDMAGGGWTRVFFHDVAEGYFASDADARRNNVSDPLALRYSILSEIEHFRSSDGAFELRIDWPDSSVAGRNIWRQNSDPTTAPVAGYQPIQIDYTSQRWGGLELSANPSTYVNGTVGHANWFYAIGAHVPWGDPPGIPAQLVSSPRVALWVRPDDSRAGGTPVFDCVAPANYVDVGGDCDDTNEDIGEGAEEICNGVDDDCDQQTDEGCAVGDITLNATPKPLHFYPRDLGSNTCAVTVEGALVGAASEVRLSLTRQGEAVAAEVSNAPEFTLAVPIEPGLFEYVATVEWSDGNGFWRPVATYNDIVCGDVFVIDGQSNAVAADYHNENLGDLETNRFVRSFGTAVNNANVGNNTGFHLAIANLSGRPGSIGQWGLRLANVIKDAEQVPILVINGAVGGTRVDQHQRNGANPEDLTTIYGRLLWRVRQAGVANNVRAIFWHQGESDGGLPFDTYLARWTAMYDGWLADYPNVEAVFLFQIRAGCGGPTWNRNIQRELPELLERVASAMSTTAVDGHDNCHFLHAVYAEWGERMARIVLRDLYDAAPPGNIDAPDPQSATWRSNTELVIEYGPTGGGLVLQPGAEAYFSLSDGAAIVDVSVQGTAIVLTSAAPSAAEWVSFLDVAGDIPWLINDLGIGGFAYLQFPISP